MMRSGRSRVRKSSTWSSCSRSHDAERGTATVCPAASSLDTRWRPRNPVPPVTTYFIDALPRCAILAPCTRPSPGVAPGRPLLDERDHAQHLADPVVEGDHRVIAERIDFGVRHFVVALVEVLADVGLVQIEGLERLDRHRHF